MSKSSQDTINNFTKSELKTNSTNKTYRYPGKKKI